MFSRQFALFCNYSVLSLLITLEQIKTLVDPTSFYGVVPQKSFIVANFSVKLAWRLIALAHVLICSRFWRTPLLLRTINVLINLIVVFCSCWGLGSMKCSFESLPLTLVPAQLRLKPWRLLCTHFRPSNRMISLMWNGIAAIHCWICSWGRSSHAWHHAAPIALRLLGAPCAVVLLFNQNQAGSLAFKSGELPGHRRCTRRIEDRRILIAMRMRSSVILLNKSIRTVLKIFFSKWNKFRQENKLPIYNN